MNTGLVGTGATAFGRSRPRTSATPAIVAPTTTSARGVGRAWGGGAGGVAGAWRGSLGQRVRPGRTSTARAYGRAPAAVIPRIGEAEGRWDRSCVLERADAEPKPARVPVATRVAPSRLPRAPDRPASDWSAQARVERSRPADAPATTTAVADEVAALPWSATVPSGGYATRWIAGTSSGASASVRRNSRANSDGTYQRRKYSLQPTQIPVTASSVWSAATAATSSHPERRGAEQERDARQRQEREAERLREPRRVLVLQLGRAELEGPLHGLPGTTGEEEPRPEEGRDPEVDADEHREPGEVQQERDGEDDGRQAGAEALAARVDRSGRRGCEQRCHKGLRVVGTGAPGQVRDSGCEARRGEVRRCLAGDLVLDPRRRSPTTGALQVHTAQKGGLTHGASVRDARLPSQ